MDENNPIYKFFKDNFPSLAGFLGVIVLALAPLLGKAAIDRATGKQKGDQEVTAASVTQSILTGVQELTELQSKIMKEAFDGYEMKLADAAKRYAQLETSSAKEKREIERLLTQALEKVEKQNAKLKEQYEKLRGENAQLRRNLAVLTRQIIDEYHGIPNPTPLTGKVD